MRTAGKGPNTAGVGARLSLYVGDRVLVRTVRAGSSYQGQNDLRVHFGLGEAASAERLEIEWPGGATDIVENIEANAILTVSEGDGVTGRVPFSREDP